ncbi:MAG TPA: ABC transporter permease [Bacillota bacterium]|nr:ABC transporter permease [Bacillota bacterium]
MKTLTDTIYGKIKQASGLLFGTIFIFIALSILAEGFLSTYNCLNILKDFSILLIISLGMTLTILLGKLDMSVGSVMSLSGIVTTLLIANHAGLVLSIAGGLASGLIIGLINGYFVGVQKFDYFIVTFASLSIAKGLAQVICNGNIISCESSAFGYLGSGKLLGVYLIIWIAIIIFFISYFVTKKTSFGYKLYSVGGSEAVSSLSAIKSKRIYVTAFAVCGLMAAVSGILLAARAYSGNATAGAGYEFNAIAAVLVGGTPFDGGKGGVKGTFLGALFITILKNGLNLLGFSSPLQYTLIGLIILIAIVADVFIDERKKINDLRRVEL